MPISPTIRDLIFANAAVRRSGRKAIEEGMVTLRQSGLRKISQGVTTMEEVFKETA